MSLIFREHLESEDVARLRDIVISTGFFTNAEIDIAVELMEDCISLGAQSDYHFILAHEGDKVVGYSCYGPISVTHSAHDLYWIAVDPQVQGKGVGKKLLKETELKVKNAGGTRLFAETSSQPKYTPTQKFYERSGFIQESVVQDFYADGDHLLTYSKKL